MLTFCNDNVYISHNDGSLPIFQFQKTLIILFHDTILQLKSRINWTQIHDDQYTISVKNRAIHLQLWLTKKETFATNNPLKNRPSKQKPQREKPQWQIAHLSRFRHSYAHPYVQPTNNPTVVAKIWLALPEPAITAVYGGRRPIVRHGVGMVQECWRVKVTPKPLDTSPDQQLPI